MNAKIIPIVIEKETVSDNLYTIGELYYRDGDNVQKRDIILAYETSKSSVEVESPSSGYIYYNVKEGEEIAVGAICAVVSRSPNIPNDYFDRFDKKSVNSSKESLTTEDANGIRVSRAAKAMLKENNLNLSIFKGKTILRTKDIYEYLKSGTAYTKTSRYEEIKSQNKIIVIGGGGHGKMCIDIIRQMKTYRLVGIIDSNLEIGVKTMGVPVIGREEDLEKLFKGGIKFATIGFGALHKPIIRQELFHKLKNIGYFLPNLIHPYAILEPSVTLGEGNQIMAGAILGSAVRVGNNCIINSGSIVSHDSFLHTNVHVTPGAMLAGSVIVESNTIIGMGVTIYNKVKVGSNVIISNGMNIINNIPDGKILKR